MKGLDQGDVAGAIDKLKSFINEVLALRGRMIPADEADALIAQAEAILSAAWPR